MTKFQVDNSQPERPPRAWLVTVTIGRAIHPDAAAELRELVLSDGAEPVGLTQVRREKPDAAYFIGSGKVEELAASAKAAAASALVFDAPLTAAQQRNLEKATGVAVLDRTELILEIFRRRAKSSEGKLQIELARLEHLSTRLVRGWTHLERQRGGLSKTGGPGEKQIELDRRMIGARVRQLREQLERIARQRATRRRAASRGTTLRVSLVGYTNAGKSTLFNALTRTGVYAADQLFATLDTTARRCWIADGVDVILSDTVGFIRGLPHQLIEAFKATLDEAVEADVLLHVVDSASIAREAQMAEVRSVLEEIGAGHVPVITVYNKCDLTGYAPTLTRDEAGKAKTVALSAATGAGLDLLRTAIGEFDADLRARRQKEKDEREALDADWKDWNA